MSEKKPGTVKYKRSAGSVPQLTRAQARAVAEAAIDYSDIPEPGPEFWVQAEPKTQITLRLDKDVVDFFRATGRMYQTRINAVLRSFVDAQRGRREPNHS